MLKSKNCLGQSIKDALYNSIYYNTLNWGKKCEPMSIIIKIKRVIVVNLII